MGRFVYLTACAVVLSGFYAAAATVVPYTGDVFVTRVMAFGRLAPDRSQVGDLCYVSPNGLAKFNWMMVIHYVSPGYVLSWPQSATQRYLHCG